MNESLSMRIASCLLVAFLACSCDSNEDKARKAGEKAAQELTAKLRDSGFITDQEKKRLDGPETRAKVDERIILMKKDSDVVEFAPWFGTTGLEPETERQVSQYLRLEFGQVYSDADSIKARDLEYVGHFAEGAKIYYFWRIPRQSQPIYAYVEKMPNGNASLGWGDKSPPADAVRKE